MAVLSVLKEAAVVLCRLEMPRVAPTEMSSRLPSACLPVPFLCFALRESLLAGDLENMFASPAACNRVQNTARWTRSQE